jgi:hypothetical protein
VKSVVGTLTWPSQQRRHMAGGEHAPAMRSNADRVIFGRDIDRSEDADGGCAVDVSDGAAAAEPPHPVSQRSESNWHHQKLLPHQKTQADEVILGHDTDRSSADPPLIASLAAAFDGAAGLDSDVATRIKIHASRLDERSRPHSSPSPQSHRIAAARPVPPMPHTLSTADEVISGRDLDGTASVERRERPETSELRAGGAAGQYAPRGPYPHELDLDPYPHRPEDPSVAVATSLRDWGSGGDNHAAERGVSGTRRAHVPPPSLSKEHSVPHAERAHVGPPPQPSPISPPRWAKHTASSRAAASSPESISFGSSGGKSAPVALEGAVAAGVPKGTRVLRLSQSPPLPPSARGSATAAGPPQSLSRATSTFVSGEYSASVAVNDAPAAGRPTAREPKRPLGANPAGDADAAGCRFCTFSANQRKYGGQIALNGGLG